MPRSRLHRNVAAVVLPLLLVLAACVGGSGTSSGPAADPGGPQQRGGTLRLVQAAQTDSATHDPARLAGWDGYSVGPAAQSIYDTLVDPRVDGTVLPRIATSTTTPDATTVVATLTERDAPWPAVLAGRLGMIPSPTTVTRFGDRYGTTPESLVGTGPFTVTSWPRNPTFWNPYVATHPELLVEIEREDAEILAAFRSPPGAGLPPSSASENTPVPGGQS